MKYITTIGLTLLLLAGSVRAVSPTNMLPVGANASSNSAARPLSEDQRVKALQADNSFLWLRVRFTEQRGKGYVNYYMTLIGCDDLEDVQADCSVFYRSDEGGRHYVRADSLGLSITNHTISSPWLWMSDSSKVEGVLLRLSRRNSLGELIVREFEEGHVPSEKDRKKYRVNKVAQ
jgi:hypothetical protein